VLSFFTGSSTAHLQAEVRGEKGKEKEKDKEKEKEKCLQSVN
jgi:hypothetical protein